MAVTIDAATLADLIGADVTRAGQLLAAVSETVTRYAPDAPDTVQNEATIRYAGYLAQSDYGGIRSETVGPVATTWATNHAAAFRYCGAAGLLTRYKRRRAGKI